MKKLIFSLALVLSLACHGQIVKSGWTSTATPSLARLALGISETNAMGINVTNVYTNFNVAFLTIGTGSNAITLTPTNGSITSDVGLSLPWITATTVTGTTVVATSVTLGGSNRTEWPAAGVSTGGGGATAGGITVLLTYSTNYAPVSALTNLGYFTKGYYQATWTSTNGDVLAIESSADAVTWADADPSTNANYLRLVTSVANLNGLTPAVSNLFIYSITAGFNGTNDFRTTTFLADSPEAGDEVATKGYVDTAAIPKTWSNYKAVSTTRLNRNTLSLTPEWSWAQSISSNQVHMNLTFAGTPLITFAPGFTGISNGVTIVDGTYITVNVATNNAPGPFRVLCSTNDLLNWFEVAATNSYPTAVGTNYTLTFPKTDALISTLICVGRSNATAIATSGATLASGPITIATNSASGNVSVNAGGGNVTNVGTIHAATATVSGTLTAPSYLYLGSASQYVRAMSTDIQLVTFGGYGVSTPSYFGLSSGVGLTADTILDRLSIGVLRCRTNFVAIGTITATNGVVYPSKSSAPTLAQIGATNVWFTWASNGTPPLLVGSYYDAASNIVSKTLAP